MALQGRLSCSERSTAATKPGSAHSPHRASSTTLTHTHSDQGPHVTSFLRSHVQLLLKPTAIQHAVCGENGGLGHKEELLKCKPWGRDGDKRMACSCSQTLQDTQSSAFANKSFFLLEGGKKKSPFIL